MVQRVRLTIEWDGIANAPDYASVLAGELERGDQAGRTRVVGIEYLTPVAASDLRWWRRLRRSILRLVFAGRLA